MRRSEAPRPRRPNGLRAQRTTPPRTPQPRRPRGRRPGCRGAGEVGSRPPRRAGQPLPPRRRGSRVGLAEPPSPDPGGRFRGPGGPPTRRTSTGPRGGAPPQEGPALLGRRHRPGRRAPDASGSSLPGRPTPAGSRHVLVSLSGSPCSSCGSRRTAARPRGRQGSGSDPGPDVGPGQGHSTERMRRTSTRPSTLTAAASRYSAR